MSRRGPRSFDRTNTGDGSDETDPGSPGPTRPMRALRPPPSAAHAPRLGDTIVEAPRAASAAEDTPDGIFAGFVQRANAEWVASVEAALLEPGADDPAAGDAPIDHDPSIDHDAADDRAIDETVDDDRATDPPPPPALPTDPAPDPGGTDRIVLLTRPKTVRPPARATEPDRDREHESWASVVPQRSEQTQKREAARLVPDVASVPPPAQPPQEGSEDGQMPSFELDRKLSDMDVLLRYGHAAQVQSELESLRIAYPTDLLLLRRIAELYVAHDMTALALDTLFALATGLFERRNVEGMRQALEQVRVLDPDNGRAARLLSLLEQRPSAPPPAR